MIYIQLIFYILSLLFLNFKEYFIFGLDGQNTFFFTFYHLCPHTFIFPSGFFPRFPSFSSRFLVSPLFTSSQKGGGGGGGGYLKCYFLPSYTYKFFAILLGPSSRWPSRRTPTPRRSGWQPSSSSQRTTSSPGQENYWVGFCLKTLLPFESRTVVLR